MFPDIKMKHLIPKLTARLKLIPAKYKQIPVPEWKITLPKATGPIISQDWLWPRLSSFFRPKDVIVTETGL